MQEMEEVVFEVKESFTNELGKRFVDFMQMLKRPQVVVLDIESEGGYVHVLRTMEAEISKKKNEGFVFVTNVDNYAYSAGFLLFLLGDIRLTNDKASFMYHPAGIYTGDERLTTSTLMDIADFLQNEDDFVYKIFKENTNIDAEIFEVIKKNEVFLQESDLKTLKLIN